MTFSRILDRNGRFETGWYVFQYILIEGGFFEKGFNNSSFEVWYKTRSQ